MMANKSKKLGLKLENIGIIKEADIDISGLTVISGKNDQGKSTVGKALMAIIKADNITQKSNKKASKKPTSPFLAQQNNLQMNNTQEHLDFGKKNFNLFLELLFDSEISHNGKISLFVDNEIQCEATIQANQCKNFNTILHTNSNDKEFIDCTFIQTPLIWDLEEFFNTITIMKQDSSIYNDSFEIKYPYVLWDLYTKLVFQPLKHKQYATLHIKDKIRNLISGKFVKEQGKPYRFHKSGGDDISLKDIAVGIKTFGIIEVLLDKNRFTRKGYFIFDEPENHLHPTWQLALAETLVILAKNGIGIMINTHSPYMLEALDKYSKKHTSYTKFYLADNGFVQQIDGSNERTLEEVFKKLNEPFKIFDEMENE